MWLEGRSQRWGGGYQMDCMCLNGSKRYVCLRSGSIAIVSSQGYLVRVCGCEL